MKDIKFIKCNHCGEKIDKDDLELDADDRKLEPKIGRADRFVNCEVCQCEVLFNSKTLEVVIFC